MEKLYNIFYSFENEYYYEATTNSPEKWIKAHNKIRIKEGASIEKLENFDIIEIHPLIYK